MMDEIYKKALEAFSKVLDIHLDSKTVNDPFHMRTAEIYRTLFDIAHESGERFVDLGGKLDTNHGDTDKQGEEILKILTDLKGSMEKIDGTRGTNALVEKHLDSLEFLIGTTQSMLGKTSGGGDEYFDESKEEPAEDIKEQDRTKEEEKEDEEEALDEGMKGKPMVKVEEIEC